MENGLRNYAVLLVSGAQKSSAMLKDLLSRGGYGSVTSVCNGQAACERLAQGRFDIAILNDPLPDMECEDLAAQICRDSTAGVLLMVRSEIFPPVSRRVGPLGVLTLPKPTTETMIEQSLLLLCSTRERMRRLEERADSMEEQLLEARIVNRAKCLLIEQLRMTEQEAHRYIEKQAMDRCVTRRAIAENILSTYK